MKRLILLRHAKTERDAPGGRDFDRRLTERGRGDAARIGQAMRDLGIAVDLALCSTAARAVETAAIAGLVTRAEPRIYDAPVERLLGLVHSADEAAGSMLMVGHNPGLAMLLTELTGVDDGMPTGALAEIELDIDRWDAVGRGTGRLARFLRPKEMS